jgi:putative ABC transport system permease protein
MMGRKLFLRFRSLFRSQIVDQELDAEVRFHVEEQAAEFVRQGVPPEQAEAMARRQFGNLTLHKEECRDTRKLAWLEGLAQDLRQGLRTLRRSPGFTIVSVLTLALGIGATSAMFSVIDRAVLNPVSAPDPGKLVWLQEFSKAHSESGSNPSRLPDWQKAKTFSAMAGLYSEGLVWRGLAGPVRLSVLRIYGDLFGVLQPKLQMGRMFTGAEMRGEGQPVAIITSAAFLERFQSNPEILRQTIRLGDTPYQVIGVLDGSVGFPQDLDIWTPARLTVPSRAAGFLDLVGRLAPGVAFGTAQAELNIISSRLGAAYPATDAGRSVLATPLTEHVASAARKPLLLLFEAVASVLFIGCLNIAGLLLARGLARRREAAIRVSLGADYGRLARLFFTESLILAFAGCIGGLLLAFAGVDLLKATLPPSVPNLMTISVNMTVALGCVAVSIFAAFLFGGLPAWQFARGAQSTALKEGGAGTASITRNRLRSSLIVAEVALSAVLLTTAALLANSFLKVLNRPLGFNSAHAYTFSVELPWDTDPALITSLSSETLTRMNYFPGTIASGVVDRLPLHGGAQSGPLLVRARVLNETVAETEFGFRTASAGFFTAAGIPILAGNVFRDGADSHEAVISQRLAHVLFAGENPLGHQIASRPDKAGSEPKWFRIVGVINSVPARAMTQEPEAELYVPWGATYWPMLNFVVRSNRPLGDLAQFVHGDLQKLQAEQIFSPVTTLEEQIDETRSTPRLSALLIGAFAFVALALSALGIFGLVAHETRRRTQELGVRLALGELPRSIALGTVGRAVKLVSIGLLIGLGGAWFASVLLRNLLFDVLPHDLSAYLAASLVLLAATILAASVPAWRAAKIDPVQALRHE